MGQTKNIMSSQTLSDGKRIKMKKIKVPGEHILNIKTWVNPRSTIHHLSQVAQPDSLL